MGKHKKKNIASTPSVSMKKISNQLRNKINPQVQKLLNKCTANWDTKKDVENYTEVCNILEEIRQLEKEHVVPFPNREHHVADFLTWCSDNEAEFSAISIKEINDGNFGTIAEIDLKENDKFLSIPRKLMMSVDNAKNSKLGPLISEDPILNAMPNVVLAIFLIMEYLNKESFWQPYLSILPESYDTILYFSVDDLKEMQRSPAQSQAINLCRSVARQYAYFQKLFQNSAYASKLEIGHYFTYDLYRWAVSTVMTRQNSIPTSDGTSITTALIPIWDMCNHAEGKLSTNFDIEENCIKSYSMQNFLKGEEVCMYYGSRSNGEFFIHNGFVYPENGNDWIPLILSISKSDPLFAAKTTLCLKLGISLSGKFQITRNSSIDPDLLTFLKINVLKTDEIDNILEVEGVLEEYMANNEDIKERSLMFLRDRAGLLLNCYTTTLEGDENILECEQNRRRRMAIQLRICEKKLLNECLSYCMMCLASKEN